MHVQSSSAMNSLTATECRYLMACVDQRPQSVDGIRLSQVIETAKRHQIIPLLAERLKDTTLDPTVRTRLDELTKQIHERIERGHRTFNNLVQILQLHGINAVFFKGPILSDLYYGSPWLRAYADIDVLVLHDTLERAEKLLKELHYHIAQLQHSDLQWMVGQRPTEDRAMYFTPDETRSLYLKNHCHFPYVPNDTTTGLRVDLHWEVFPKNKYTLPAVDLLARAIPVKVIGQDILTFSPVDTVLYVCLHVAMDGYERIRLMKLADVVRCAASLDDTQWDEARARIKEYNIGQPVYLALWIAHHALGHSLPPGAQRLVRHSLSHSMMKAFISHTSLIHRNSPCADAVWDIARGTLSWATLDRTARGTVKQLGLKTGLFKTASR
jgi:hypothetical protein